MPDVVQEIDLRCRHPSQCANWNASLQMCCPTRRPGASTTSMAQKWGHAEAQTLAKGMHELHGMSSSPTSARISTPAQEPLLPQHLLVASHHPQTVKGTFAILATLREHSRAIERRALCKACKEYTVAICSAGYLKLAMLWSIHSGMWKWRTTVTAGHMALGYWWVETWIEVSNIAIHTPLHDLTCNDGP